MEREHRIDRPGNRLVPLQDRGPQLVVAAFRPKSRELVVQVEHHCWGVEAPRRAAGLRMKSDDEECLPPETHREMGILGVVRDARIGRLAEPFVLVAQGLEPFPEPFFEALFVMRRTAFEQDDKRLEQLGFGAIACGKVEQRRHDPQIVPAGSEIARHDEPHAVALQRRFRANAGEGAIGDEGAETVRKRMVAIVVGWIHYGFETERTGNGCGALLFFPLASLARRG